MMAGGVIWVQLNGASIFPLRSRPVPIIVLGDHGARGVRFSKVWIEFQRLQCCCACLRHELGRRGNAAISTHERIRLSQSGISRGIVRIPSGCLLKIDDRLSQSVRRTLVPEVTALEV